VRCGTDREGEMANELKERGNDEFKKGRLEEAVALYTEAISSSLGDKAMLGTILSNRFGPPPNASPSLAKDDTTLELLAI
jgi:hypothetical protein